MTTIIENIEFGTISNVRKSGDEENVYFADVEISFSEGEPLQTLFYCARKDDIAPTGKWVYQNIIEGNIEGSIVQFEKGANPVTGKLPTLEELAVYARDMRDSLLAQSDWTQLPDIPQSVKDIWSTYRQELRDITQQVGFPTNIAWPVQPA